MENKNLNEQEIKNMSEQFMFCVDDKIYLISVIFQTCFAKKYIENNKLNKDLYNESKYFVDSSNSIVEVKNLKEGLNKLTFSDLKEITKYITLNYSSLESFRFSESCQGKELNDLIYDCLNLNKENDSVFEFGFKQGNFLVSLLNRADKEGIKIKSISGCELMHSLSVMTKMVFSILDYKDIDVNLMECDGLRFGNFTFNKGFAFPPFGLKGVFDSYKASNNTNYGLVNKLSFEWAVVDKMINSSKDFERIVVILSPKCLYNSAENDYRKSLIKNGLIEGIIELPNNLFEETTIKTYMLILSKNNKEIRFVDSSNMIQGQSKKYAKNILDNKKVFEAYNSNNVEKISNDELLKRNELDLTHISELKVNFKNAVSLSSVAKVSTGSQYTLRNFEKYLCEDEKYCTYKLIASNDIDEYSINWNNLKMINNDDKKLEKFAVQKNDVIITSKSSKVKIAVVDFDPKIKCIVTGGMFIVRPDTNKLNPYYLKVFLESSIGTEILESIQKGGSYIVTIKGSNLANIKINLIDINKQNLIANKYIDKLTSLIGYKKQIKDIETSLSNLYQDECED